MKENIFEKYPVLSGFTKINRVIGFLLILGAGIGFLYGLSFLGESLLEKSKGLLIISLSITGGFLGLYCLAFSELIELFVRIEFNTRKNNLESPNCQNRINQNDNYSSLQNQTSLPPLPTDSRQIYFFVSINEERKGPYDIPKLSLMYHIGQISKDTLVWKEGMKEWIKAVDCSELSVLFNTK